MKSYISILFSGILGVAIAAGLSACSAENPFDSDGSGTVHFRTVVNPVTTRADGDAGSQNYEQYLRDNCVVYVSSSKGLIFKEKGLDNVPESMVLKTGSYVAEAWSGDSVTASFDKMFFRAYEPFEVTAGNTSSVILNCKIQNVVVSVNTATIDPNLMLDDYQVVVKNTRGQLSFDKDNAGSARGYFMMPNGDTDLEINITGTRKDGDPFTKTETIRNVERAHHYILNFNYNPGNIGDDSTGAVFLRIDIKDENLNDVANVTVPTAPTISGVEFDVDKQQVFTSDDAIPEAGLSLKVCAFGKLDENTKINIATSSYSELGLPNDKFNILGLSDINKSQCNAAGLSWTNPEHKVSTDVSTMFVTFDKDMLRKLTAKASEHQISITAIDSRGQSTTSVVRIARSEEAIVLADPIVVNPIDTQNLLNITGSTAVIPFNIDSDIEGTPGIEYRKSGDENWTFVAVNAPALAPTRAMQKREVTLTGLEPGTEYQYRARCGDFIGEDVFSFTTESKFIIPNASFEEWSTYKASTLLGTKTITLPGSTGNKMTSFWGSGNEGSATANKTLTTQSSDMFHSGSSSARLASASAVGIIAAGNIFVGYYDRTDGTNGVLQLGREYNGSHPAKVRVYANYRPGGDVTVNSDNAAYIDDLKKGGTDQGQIYIALTDEPVEIRTNPSNRKLFDANDPHVLAYGQVTWKEAFGPDGQLQQLDIPFEYNDRAKTKHPTHIVIVCSASKFGDYFCGSAKSVMYLDDFELIY